MIEGVLVCFAGLATGSVFWLAIILPAELAKIRQLLERAQR